MTWIWLSTIIVLLGAEINAEDKHQAAHDTTQGAGRAARHPRRQDGRHGRCREGVSQAREYSKQAANKEVKWVEGRNLLIEGRYAAGRAERFAEFAAELVALDVEVIVVLGGSQATQVAKQATSKIPIVFSGMSNPIESGFITSFARPGGNVTGVSNQLGDLLEKFVELLRAFAPSLQRSGPTSSRAAKSCTYHPP